MPRDASQANGSIYEQQAWEELPALGYKVNTQKIRRVVPWGHAVDDGTVVAPDGREGPLEVKGGGVGGFESLAAPGVVGKACEEALTGGYSYALVYLAGPGCASSQNQRLARDSVLVALIRGVEVEVLWRP